MEEIIEKMLLKMKRKSYGKKFDERGWKWKLEKCLCKE